MNFFNRARLTACAVTAFLALAVPQIARADDVLQGHLPIIDFRPVATWANAGGMGSGNAGGTPPPNGGIELTGTATVPLFKGLSFSYDRVAGGLLWGSFGSVAFPGAGIISVGSYKDVVQNYRLDYVVNPSFTVELGLATRHRECCPASGDPTNPDSTQWQTGNLGVTYTSPSYKWLNHGVFVLNLTGHTANHQPSPNALAGQPPGQDIAGPGGKKQEYGTSQAITAVVPVDIRNRLTATATYTWGALDYFENEPFPYSYKIWIFGLNKTVNPYLGFELQAFNLWQGQQGSPFPVPNAIHLVQYAVTADIHLDLNHIFASAPKK